MNDDISIFFITSKIPDVYMIGTIFTGQDSKKREGILMKNGNVESLERYDSYPPESKIRFVKLVDEEIVRPDPNG